MFAMLDILLVVGKILLRPNWTVGFRSVFGSRNSFRLALPLLIPPLLVSASFGWIVSSAN